MSEQLDLMTPPAQPVRTTRARPVEPETAPDVAHRNRMREAIVAWIRTLGADGATRHEVEMAFGLKTQTTCWRLREAERLGEIGKTDRKREACTVYIAFKI